METAKIMNTIELQKMVDKLCAEKDGAVHVAADYIKENIKQQQEILKLTARIAELVSSNMVMAKGVLDLKARIAELEGKFDQLTARWRQERQDDKWIPEVQE